MVAPGLWRLRAAATRLDGGLRRSRLRRFSIARPSSYKLRMPAALAVRPVGPDVGVRPAFRSVGVAVEGVEPGVVAVIVLAAVPSPGGDRFSKSVFVFCGAGRVGGEKSHDWMGCRGSGLATRRRPIGRTPSRKSWRRLSSHLLGIRVHDLSSASRLETAFSMAWRISGCGSPHSAAQRTAKATTNRTGRVSTVRVCRSSRKGKASAWARRTC